MMCIYQCRGVNLCVGAVVEGLGVGRQYSASGKPLSLPRIISLRQSELGVALRIPNQKPHSNRWGCVK